MTIFPRHIKVLKTIKRFGSCCDPLLSQASGLYTAWNVAKELANAGYLYWSHRKDKYKFNGIIHYIYRPPGWALTPKGQEILK